MQELRVLSRRSQSFVWSASTSRRKCTRPDSSRATIVRPSGVTAQLCISPSPVKVAISFPLSKSQSRSVWSSEAETARRPSGVTATVLTEFVWPSTDRIVWPLSKSQSRSVRSSEPETARRPSGVTATAQTQSVCPRASGSFGCSPNPRAAAFGPPKPRRHGGRRALFEHRRLRKIL